MKKLGFIVGENVGCSRPGAPRWTSHISSSLLYFEFRVIIQPRKMILKMMLPFIWKYKILSLKLLFQGCIQSWRSREVKTSSISIPDILHWYWNWFLHFFFTVGLKKLRIVLMIYISYGTLVFIQTEIELRYLWSTRWDFTSF